MPDDEMSAFLAVKSFLALGSETWRSTESMTPTSVQLHFIRKMVEKGLLIKKSLEFWYDTIICLVPQNKISYEPI